MNLHDQYNFRRGLKEGIEQGISQGISKGIAQGLQQGISQGAQQKAIETAKILLLKNISVDIISECTGLSVDEIKELTK